MKFAKTPLATALMNEGRMPGLQAFSNNVDKEAAKEEFRHKMLAEHNRPDRKTRLNPQQQAEVYHAAEAKRLRRARRNLRNAGLDASDKTEGDLL